MEGHLVISPYAQDSAQEVCGSSTSKGPDFVSLQDGFHCDMTTRELTPICSEQVGVNCFDTEVSQMRASGSMRGATRARSVRHKQYHSIHRWGQSN